jgi:small subunit ribosomal protein S1
VVLKKSAKSEARPDKPTERNRSRKAVRGRHRFGTFQLGGVDGLLHLTDMTWGRVGLPSDVGCRSARSQGQVLDFPREEKDLAGLKRLSPHPWKV